MERSDWGYVALCLILPLLWGCLSASLFDWWRARSRQESADEAAEAGADLYQI